VLQGGGALGAYQAGVYEALAEADIIAGNPPPSRAERLREILDACDLGWTLVLFRRDTFSLGGKRCRAQCF
jgi:predicted acylesterase/phospholipase RssA